MSPADVFATRKAQSERAIRELEALVSAELAPDADALAGTTIYVTGSTARGEMSTHSDIDLFVVRVDGEPSRLHDAAITTAIRRGLRTMQKPPPSQDGRFLQMQLAEKLVQELGTDNDDFYNHFTGRMLLLLESRPLRAGDAAYAALINLVLDRYWKYAEHRPDGHIPYLLVNDIVRYWRVLLLNYEAKVGGQGPNEGERRLASYKLRFSRCLLCFSALAYLTAAFLTTRNLTKDLGLKLTALSPLERLDEVATMVPAEAPRVGRLKELYAEFLGNTDADKESLVFRFGDAEYRRGRALEGRAFGDEIFGLMMALGEGAGRPVLRIILV